MFVQLERRRKADVRRFTVLILACISQNLNRVLINIFTKINSRAIKHFWMDKYVLERLN